MATTTKTNMRAKKKSFRLLAITVGCVALVSSLLAVWPAYAQNKSRRWLLALSKADNVLAIIDPVSLKVVARVPVGPDPHEVVASADGSTAYVSNMGNGGSYEINVIDLRTQKALPNVDTRPLYGPHGMFFAGGKVWFTAQDSKAIGRYDPETQKLDWSMGTGQDWTHMLYVTGDEQKVYTTNVRSGTVSIFENVLQKQGPMGPPPGGRPGGDPYGHPSGNGRDGHSFTGPRMRKVWQQTVIPVSRGSEGFDVSPDGREIWTVAADDGVISIIDTGKREVVATIDAKILGANRLRFTPDGKQVFISNLRNGDLFIYDAATRKEIKSINIGHGAAGILMDAEGKRAFVACTADNYVAVINLTDLKLTAKRIDIGKPDGMDWAIIH